MVYSLVQDGFELKPIEIEVNVTPGLPKFQFLGLADSAIKESVARIRSALKAQGFHIPLGQQVLVNLKPAYEPKSSAGLDLAVAVAYLLKTEQLQLPEALKEKRLMVYGELGLEGEAIAPNDIESFLQADEWSVVTGPQDQDLCFEHFQVRTLADFASPNRVAGKQITASERPPIDPDLRVSAKTALLLRVAAAGEHSTFIGGPAGSGKTTFAQMLWSLLSPVESREFLELRALNRRFVRPENERPLVAPHHTTSSQGLLGGGMQIYAGEISKAHRGLLLLDEFLEFRNEVKESLREPIERGYMTVRRGSRSRKFPADFLLVATSNLCPCGSYAPNRPVNCRYSLARCRSTLERLSGPLLDRFDICGFSHDWRGERTHHVSQLSQDVDLAVAFRKVRGQTRPNHYLKLEELEEMAKQQGVWSLLPESIASRRRTRSLLSVARTLADLDARAEIQPADISAAMELCLIPFQQLERWA